MITEKTSRNGHAVETPRQLAAPAAPLAFEWRRIGAEEASVTAMWTEQIKLGGVAACGVIAIGDRDVRDKYSIYSAATAVSDNPSRLYRENRNIGTSECLDGHDVPLAGHRWRGRGRHGRRSAGSATLTVAASANDRLRITDLTRHPPILIDRYST